MPVSTEILLNEQIQALTPLFGSRVHNEFQNIRHSTNDSQEKLKKIRDWFDEAKDIPELYNAFTDKSYHGLLQNLILKGSTASELHNSCLQVVKEIKNSIAPCFEHTTSYYNKVLCSCIKSERYPEDPSTLGKKIAFSEMRTLTMVTNSVLHKMIKRECVAILYSSQVVPYHYSFFLEKENVVEEVTKLQYVSGKDCFNSLCRGLISTTESIHVSEDIVLYRDFKTENGVFCKFPEETLTWYRLKVNMSFNAIETEYANSIARSAKIFRAYESSEKLFFSMRRGAVLSSHHFRFLQESGFSDECLDKSLSHVISPKDIHRILTDFFSWAKDTNQLLVELYKVPYLT